VVQNIRVTEMATDQVDGESTDRFAFRFRGGEHHLYFNLIGDFCTFARRLVVSSASRAERISPARTAARKARQTGAIAPHSDTDVQVGPGGRVRCRRGRDALRIFTMR